MTSCWSGCWIGFTDSLRSLRRTLYLTGRSGNRARYSEANATVEIETLIDDGDCEFEPTPSFARRILTDTEEQLINQRKYDQLVVQQRKHDLKIDAQLQKEEDDLRLEEEAFYEAKRKAARVAKQARDDEEKKAFQNNKHKNSKLPDNTSLSSWLSDDGFSMDSADLDAEDFDSFLEKVKARSLTSSKQPGGTTSTAHTNGVLTNGYSWESSIAHSAEATKVTGKSLDAFKILDLTAIECDDRATDVER